MQVERRRAHRYPFVATAEVEDYSGVRVARVKDLSFAGAYLAMRNPFFNGASIIIKIHTKTEFFQCHATVAHSSPEGVGVMFRDISPPFLIVLQGWLFAAMREPIGERYLALSRSTSVLAEG
jgi:hypothetical protein